MDSPGNNTGGEATDTMAARHVQEALERHEASLMAYALSIAANVEVARDAVQDTFLRLYEHPPGSLDGHLLPWLFTVCRNRVLDVRRKERRMMVMNESELEQRPALDGDKPGWRRRSDFATCIADWQLTAIERNGSDPTSHGQWVDTDLLGKLPMVESRVPELPDQLIDLDLVATAARTLDVMHPAPSPGSHRYGNHGVHHTLTVNEEMRVSTATSAVATASRPPTATTTIYGVHCSHSLKPHISSRWVPFGMIAKTYHRSEYLPANPIGPSLWESLMSQPEIRIP